MLPGEEEEPGTDGVVKREPLQGASGGGRIGASDEWTSAQWHDVTSVVPPADEQESTHRGSAGESGDQPREAAQKGPSLSGLRAATLREHDGEVWMGGKLPDSCKWSQKLGCGQCNQRIGSCRQNAACEKWQAAFTKGARHAWRFACEKREEEVSSRPETSSQDEIFITPKKATEHELQSAETIKELNIAKGNVQLLQAQLQGAAAHRRQMENDMNILRRANQALEQTARDAVTKRHLETERADKLSQCLSTERTKRLGATLVEVEDKHTSTETRQTSTRDTQCRVEQADVAVSTDAPTPEPSTPEPATPTDVFTPDPVSSPAQPEVVADLKRKEEDIQRLQKELSDHRMMFANVSHTFQVASTESAKQLKKSLAEKDMVSFELKEKKELLFDTQLEAESLRNELSRIRVELFELQQKEHDL